MTFTYDSGGNNITSATSGPGTGQPSVTLTAGYDSLHSMTSLSDNITGNLGLMTFVYDASERLTTITTSYGGTAGPEIITSYAPNNQISAQSRTIGGSGTEVNTTYQYDAADRQTTITDYVSGGSALATYVYSYDNGNRLTTMVDSDGTYTYTYDNANELTSVYEGGTQVESYAYDANGNRTGTGYSTTVMNETLTSPGVTYTYDAAGNMISANSGGTITTYTYDYRNRLTEVERAGTIIATYTYNALNQRIGIDDSGGGQMWTVYNGTSADALPYGDFNGSGTLLTRYVSGPGMVNGAVVNELLARTSSGGTTAWYLTDKLDSVRDIVSSSGSELDHIVYDSFGNILTETNASNGDRFKFAGMEYDPKSAQYLDHARWYGSAIGRFLSQDPLQFEGKDVDLYRYVNNDSVDQTDPRGLQDQSTPTVENLAGGYWAGSPTQPGNPWPMPTGPIPTGPVNNQPQQGTVENLASTFWSPEAHEEMDRAIVDGLFVEFLNQIGSFWPNWLGYLDLNFSGGVFGGGVQVGPSNYGPGYFPSFHIYGGLQASAPLPAGASLTVAPYQKPTPGINIGAGGFLPVVPFGGQVGYGFNPVNSNRGVFWEVGAGTPGVSAGGWLVSGDVNPLNYWIWLVRTAGGLPTDSNPPSKPR